MIPTAEEFLDGIVGKDCYPTDTPYAMIEFAKFHVEAALRNAADNVEIKQYDEHMKYSPHVDAQSILNSYSLEKIK